MPGISLTGWQAPAAQFAASVASAPATAPETTTEPALDCYVYATCTDYNAPTLTIWKIAKPRHIHARHRTLIHILTRVNEGGDLVPVPGGLTWLEAGTCGRCCSERRLAGSSGRKSPGSHPLVENRGTAEGTTSE
jgi:hypothetical protein